MAVMMSEAPKLNELFFAQPSAMHAIWEGQSQLAIWTGLNEHRSKSDAMYLLQYKSYHVIGACEPAWVSDCGNRSRRCIQKVIKSFHLILFTVNNMIKHIYVWNDSEPWRCCESVLIFAFTWLKCDCIKLLQSPLKMGSFFRLNRTR